MRYKIFFILFLVGTLSFSINTSKRDSLEALLKTSSGKEKMRILSGLTDIYIPISILKAEKYAKESIRIANKLQDTIFIAIYYRQLGSVKLFQEKRDSAIFYFYKSLYYLKLVNDIDHVASTKANIATVFLYQNKYNKALELYQESLINFINSGSIKEQAVIYNNIGKVFQKKGENNEAIKYFLKSIELKDIEKDDLSIAYTFSNIGRSYSNLGNNELAEKNLLKALDILNYHDDKYSIAITSFYLGEHYLSILEFEKSNIYFQQSINISSANKYYNILKNNYLLLTKLYEARGNYKQALKYHYLFENIKDTVLNAEDKRILLEFETKYETDKKNNEIDRLNIDNTTKEEKLYTRTLLLFFFIIAFVLLLLLVLIILLQKRNLSKANTFLLKQNIEAVKTENELKQLKSEVTQVVSAKQSDISDKRKTELRNNLIEILETKKIYKNSKLTLSSLSKELDSNTSYLSKVINDEFNMNFNNFINSYRIKEARRLLSNPDNFNYTIASIAEEVGFNSISVFNKAFKDTTGLTPSFFLKSMKA